MLSLIHPFYFLSASAAILLALLFPVTRHLDRKADKRSYYRMQGIMILGAVLGAKISVLIGDYQRVANDTGSPEIQIAILTTRVGDLTEHLRTHKKDYASRRGLLMMVSRRRRLLDYLKTVDPQRYLDVIRRLDIRK